MGKKRFLLLFILLIISCSKESKIINQDENQEREEISLFYDCENIEAIEPYKFDFFDSNGIPITYDPSNIKYDTIRDRLIVLDRKKFQILIISQDGKLIHEISCEGEAVSELLLPRDFDFDRFANIYVIDNRKVEIYDSTGNEIRSFLPKYIPSQILVEDTNSIYILTIVPGNGKILAKYNIKGDLLEEYIDMIEIDFIESSEKIMLEMLANQTTMTMDNNKNVYVAFANEYRIVKMDNEGNIDYNYIVKELPFEIIKPHVPKDSTDRLMSLIIYNISIDEKGNLYVLWGENFGEPYCRVDVWDKDGNQIKVLKLSIPYTGVEKGMGYIMPLQSIEVFSNYLYATENYAEGMIYRYDIGEIIEE